MFSVDSEGRYKLVEEYYEYNENEKKFLQENFSLSKDIAGEDRKLDTNEYVFYIPEKFLKQFVSRFKTTKNKEMNNGLIGRVNEILTKKNLPRMKYIEYTVAREYSTGLMKEESSGHIQIEFIDYIELLLNKEQRNIFLELSKQYQEEYIFKTMKEIKEDRYIKDEEIEFLDRDNFKKGEKIYKRSVSNQLEKKFKINRIKR